MLEGTQLADATRVTMTFDRRLASAFAVLATGISAVILVEKLQSHSYAPLAASLGWLIATPHAQSPQVPRLAPRGTTAAATRLTARFDRPASLLPDSEVCQ